MVQNIVALFAGIIFGLGLIISGMANPAIVQGFLDVFGAWNPALFWVMVGALGVTFIGVIIAKRRGKTFLNSELSFPQNTPIDKRLIIGGSLFGLGWGLIGICPAPALVLVGQGLWQGGLFMVAMLIGFKAPQWLKR